MSPISSEQNFASRHVSLLIPALLLLLILLPGLPGRGIRLHDEGHFLLAANTVSQGISGIIAGKSLSEIRDEIHRTGGTLYFTAKPGYIGMLALAGMLPGGLTAVKANSLCLAAALLLLWAVHSLAFRRGGAPAAFCAGLLLVISPLTLNFSSHALGVIPGLALVFGGVAALDARRESGVLAFLGGILAFLGVACHYNLVPLVAALGCGFVPLVRRRILLAAVGGFLGAAVLLQAGSMVADVALESAYPDFRSYAGELHHNFFAAQVQTEDGGKSVEASIPPGRRDGVRGNGWREWIWVGRTVFLGFGAAFLFGVAGSVILWRTREKGDWSALPLVLAAGVPLVLWSVYPWKVERALVTALPGLCLLAGGGYAVAVERWPRWRLALIVCVGLAGGGSLMVGIRRELPPASPYAATVERYAAWLEQAPPQAFTARSFHWRLAPVWKWYLGPERANRGLPVPGVDFASDALPLVAVLDKESDIPDPNFAGQLPEFRAAIPLPGSLMAPDSEAAGVFLIRKRDAVIP
ncbi:MAG: hypothetical protein PWP23_120 [Candidatus Sumerlaeota bacterium]|nr:hypothetical protein [Candidatus Sumerlaeota bacterium]